jgi:uncharacterized protein YjiS (DUF1127 family)
MEMAKVNETAPIKVLATWFQRADSREKLKTLSDRSLKDIGLTRQEIEREVQKPFWKA